ncbi:LysR family transcriptional regulator [Methylocella silvestris]|uniref:LysR family transcriptional regulator n=1 Tax=Methylocella silvestris TaxID=199596 RepID=UPI0001726945|nr:LysR family transcriptional regulator [Methylocella silvestris]
MADELRDLRWAIVASQHRSLRQAAEALNVRQSTLSRRLRDLEHRLGASLFERTTGGMRPTAAGREFLEMARRIVDDVDAAFARLKTHSRGESGGLTVGVCAALSAGNLRATLMEHQDRFPNVDVKGVDGRRVGLLSDLSADAIDVAIMTAGSAAWADKALPLWSERVVAAVPEGHPLYDHEVIQWPSWRARLSLSPSATGALTTSVFY